MMALVFRKWMFPGASEPFIMEMPPYHFAYVAQYRNPYVGAQYPVFEKGRDIDFAASILIWFITNYPANVEYSKDYDAAKGQITEQYDEVAAKPLLAQLDQEQAGEKLALSYAGQFGHFIEPVIKLLGFDWKMGVGLVSGGCCQRSVGQYVGYHL